MKSFSKNLDKVIPSASMAMAQNKKIECAYENIINLTWGQPDFDTPEHIKQAAYEAAAARKNSYTNFKGIPELREAISNFYSANYNSIYNSDDEILVVPGAKQGLMYSMQTLLNPGDEVILFEPCWLSYRDMILLHGGIPVFLPAGEGLAPDIERFENSITPKTKAVILNNPVNPSGFVFSKEMLQKITTIAEDNDLYIIADEIYDRIVFTEFHSLARFSDLKHRMIVINGFSKAYAMTGWRIGYLLSSKEILDKIGLIHQHTATCAASLSQYAAVSALNCEQSSVENMSKQYEKRRDLVYNGLLGSKFEIIKPEGTFYAMMDVSGVQAEPSQKSSFILKNFGIATVNGISYGDSCGNYVRLSLTIGVDELEEMIQRLKA